MALPGVISYCKITDWDLLRPPEPPEPSLLDFLDMAG